METAVVPSDDPRINALTEQIDTLTAIVAFLREHRQALVEEAGQVRAVIEGVSRNYYNVLITYPANSLTWSLC